SRPLRAGDRCVDRRRHRARRSEVRDPADHRRAPAPGALVIPLKDDVPSASVPYVTIGLIGLNVLVYLYQFSIDLGGDPQSAQAVALEFGATPCRITGACGVPGDFPSPIVTIFTSMFLHGGLLHVGGNMLYLWIFGDNVEDTLGHGRYLVLYV